MATPADRSTPGEPAVLVVIVNYNAGAMLSRAVDAMRRQTYTDYRLVVVDNASSDDSIGLMKAAHPDIEVLPAGANLGFAAANNLAVHRFPGSRWIALLNPDAFPEPDWLHVLVRGALANPNAGSFASRTLDAAEPALLDGAGDALHFSGRYWRRGHRSPASGRYAKAEEIFSACAAAALYSRSAWEQLGGLDEEFFCYGEDVDLGFRLQLAGYCCLYMPDAVALHAGSAVTGARSDFSTYHGQRNLVWVYVKDMPPLLFWILLPFHLALNVGSVLACAARGQAGVALRAKRDALAGLARAWRKRAAIQRARKISAARVWKLLEGGLPLPR